MSPEIVTLGDAGLYSVIIGSLIAACAICLSPQRLPDRVVFGGAIMVMLLIYEWHRLTSTLPEFALSAYSLWPYCYAVLESTAILYTVLSIVFFMRRTDRSQQADAAALQLAHMVDPPSVDVMICTYNEDRAILERSILAALVIDYPTFSVWVLDDGGRPWLREYCDEVGAYYVARDHHVGAKAGNLNNGIDISAHVSNAPYILVLDADFAPQRQILERTVGLFADRRIGIVQTPQFYYNADPVQHNLLLTQSWVDDQRIFFDVMQPSKDAWGAAFCVGTSFVVRRDAIEAIGGIPQETVTEDLHLTYRLLKHGLRTVWLNERLSVGLSAESLASYINQRCRWCVGTIQLALLEDGPLRSRGFSCAERLHYLHGLLFWLCRPFILALLLAPILYYFLGLPAILLSPEALLMYAAPAVVGSMVYHAWISGGKALPLFTEVAHVVAALPVTRTILQAAVKPFGHPFKVTEKGETRVRVQVHYGLAIVFMSIVLLTMVGMFNGPLLRTYGELDGFSIAWGIVVMIHCFVAGLICIELPRPGVDEIVFPLQDSGYLRTSRFGYESTILAMSVNSITFKWGPGWARLAVGERVEAEYLEGLVSAAQVVDVSPDRVTVRLVDHAGVRSQLIARLFARAPQNVAVRGRVLASLAGLAKRAFGPERYVLRTRPL